MSLSLELKSRCKDKLDALNTNVANYLDLLKNKYEQIDALKRRLDGIFGQMNYLGVFDFETSNPSQQALTDKALELAGEPLYELQHGDTIVNSHDSVDWYYNGDVWINLGMAVAGLATNLTPGIVQGDLDVFKISVDDDGKMHVNGLEEIIGMIKDGISDINEILVAQYIDDWGYQKYTHNY